MHYAKLETSPRLQRTLKFLQESKTEKSTREVSRGADIEAVNSAISELRRNGIDIKTRREGRLYYYKLVA